MPLGPRDTIVLDLGLRDQSGLDFDLGTRMDEQLRETQQACETLSRIEEHVRYRLSGLLFDFHLVLQDKGLVLRGRVYTYYAKQLAQHAVMGESSLPIRANEMEVS